MMFSNWWEDFDYPHRPSAEHFAMGIHPERLQNFPKTSRNVFFNHPLRANFRNYYHPRNPRIFNNEVDDQQVFSVAKADKDNFHVALDVQQFTPDEIKAKVVENCVVVEGKHDEKRDEHGFVMRQFIRKYLVPEECDIDKVSSSLSSDGILTLTAPRKSLEETAERHSRVINIEHTGKPALPVPSGKGSKTDKDHPPDVEKNWAKDVEEKKSSLDQIPHHDRQPDD